MHRLLASLLLIASTLCSAQAAPQPRPHDGPWVFAGFKANSEDGVFYALSRDGFHWHLANHGKPIVAPTEKGELMRDPFLQRAPDGSFRMVWTWSWRLPAVLGFSSSADLLHWSPHRQLPVLANEPTALNAWAPALFWEPAHHRWLIFWSSTIPGRVPGPPTQTNGLDHRIFATYTADFDHFTPAKVFFDPGYSVIDATFLAGRPHTLIFKDERETPLQKHLQTAAAPSLDGPFSAPSAPFTETWSEGPASIAVDGGTLVYYDHYRPPQHYGAVFSPTLTTTGNPSWKDVTSQIDFPSGLRHGSFLQLTEAEYQRLENLP
jgi:hypothetical protein